jgi:hypothetical protein
VYPLHNLSLLPSTHFQNHRSERHLENSNFLAKLNMDDTYHPILKRSKPQTEPDVIINDHLSAEFVP